MLLFTVPGAKILVAAVGAHDLRPTITVAFPVKLAGTHEPHNAPLRPVGARPCDFAHHVPGRRWRPRHPGRHDGTNLARWDRYGPHRDGEMMRAECRREFADGVCPVGYLQPYDTEGARRRR